MISEAKLRYLHVSCLDIQWKRGWVKKDNGDLKPMWSLQLVLPQSLVDILETTADDLEERNKETETEEDEEMDFEEMFDENLDI